MRDYDLPLRISRNCPTCNDYTSHRFRQVRDGKGRVTVAEYDCTTCLASRTESVTDIKDELAREARLVSDLLWIY